MSDVVEHVMENAEELVQVGDPIDVKILRVDLDDRKIGLSLKRALSGEDVEEDWDQHVPKSDSPSRGGMDDHGALGTDKIEL